MAGLDFIGPPSVDFSVLDLKVEGGLPRVDKMRSCAAQGGSLRAPRANSKRLQIGGASLMT